LTAASRVRTLVKDDQPIGFAYTVIRDAITRGWRDAVHFVDYDQFTREPQQCMVGVYEFLAMDRYEHNFRAIEQVTVENDRELVRVPGRSLRSNGNSAAVVFGSEDEQLITPGLEGHRFG
jgi:hypothetical protein